MLKGGYRLYCPLVPAFQLCQQSHFAFCYPIEKKKKKKSLFESLHTKTSLKTYIYYFRQLKHKSTGTIPMKQELQVKWCIRAVYFILILSLPLCKILRRSTEYTQIPKAWGSLGRTAGGRSRSLPQHSMSQAKGICRLSFICKVQYCSRTASRSPALPSPAPGSSPPRLPDLNPFPLTSRSQIPPVTFSGSWGLNLDPH